MSDYDHNFLTAMRIQDDEHIPFDAAAAEAMINLHRIAEARAREEVAALRDAAAMRQASFERWIASDTANDRLRFWNKCLAGALVGVVAIAGLALLAVACWRLS